MVTSKACRLSGCAETPPHGRHYCSDAHAKAGRKVYVRAYATSPRCRLLEAARNNTKTIGAPYLSRAEIGAELVKLSGQGRLRSGDKHLQRDAYLAALVLQFKKAQRQRKGLGDAAQGRIRTMLELLAIAGPRGIRTDSDVLPKRAAKLADELRRAGFDVVCERRWVLC